MRVAWLGPVGDVGGGATLGALVLECALNGGIEVDLFVQDDTAVPPHLLQSPKLRVVRAPTWWRWGKWYSRNPMSAFVSSMIARPQVHKQLCDMICKAHASQPYDCLFQNSQIELFNLRKRASELPPIMEYPGVHAFGELRWHRLESAYARQSEGAFMHYSVRAMLMYRSYVQRRDLRVPVLILGLSKRYNQLLVQDYGLLRERLEVIYHPIGSAGEPLTPLENEATPPKPMKLLYVSRISVRKGVDQIIELSKRLDDLHGEIEILVIGNRTMWSDYTAHLKDLNPRIAIRVGSVSHGKMQAIYDSSDILLLPSMYEPGGLVVGEALSRGMSIVVSDEVGSAEPINPACCARFPAGDIDAFERCTREAIFQRRLNRIQLRQLAASEAARHFSPSVIGPQIVAALERASGQEIKLIRRPSGLAGSDIQRRFVHFYHMRLPDPKKLHSATASRSLWISFFCYGGEAGITFSVLNGLVIALRYPQRDIKIIIRSGSCKEFCKFCNLFGCLWSGRGGSSSLA